MNSVDRLDVVSLLLGMALAVAAFSSVGRRWRFDDAPRFSRVLVVTGSGLLIGYALSELIHALQAGKS